MAPHGGLEEDKVTPSWCTGGSGTVPLSLAVRLPRESSAKVLKETKSSVSAPVWSQGSVLAGHSMRRSSLTSEGSSLSLPFSRGVRSRQNWSCVTLEMPPEHTQQILQPKPPAEFSLVSE